MRFTVLASLVPNVESKIQQFQRKFAKFGKGAISYQESEPYWIKNSYTADRFVDVEVEGHYQISGYEFVAKLDYIDETRANLISAVPGSVNIPEIYRTRTACDHCKSERARKHTILLQNTETKEFIQVGRQCVKDYLGCDVNSFMSYYASFESLLDYVKATAGEKHSRVDTGFDVQDILEQTVAEVAANGYTSQAMIDKWYNENTDIIEALDVSCPFKKTSSVVFHIINKTADQNGKALFPRRTITEEMKQKVEEIRDFIANIARPSDYEFNLQNLLQLDFAEVDQVGLVASAVGYYNREMKKQEEANKPEVEKSAFIGQVGEKIEFSAKPECLHSYDNGFGMCHIYRFMVGKDVIIWKTNKSLDAGAELQVKGTVKAHNLFGNTRQTEVTRCRVTV